MCHFLLLSPLLHWPLAESLGMLSWVKRETERDRLRQIEREWWMWMLCFSSKPLYCCLPNKPKQVKLENWPPLVKYTFRIIRFWRRTLLWAIVVRWREFSEWILGIKEEKLLFYLTKVEKLIDWLIKNKMWQGQRCDNRPGKYILILLRSIHIHINRKHNINAILSYFFWHGLPSV